MRKITAALLCGALVLNGGCSVVRSELRYPGGYPGRLLDKRTFDASQSKQLQLFRATLMIAIAAQIGSRSVEPQDADAFARHLAEASREVNYAAADAGFDVGNKETCTVGRGFDNASSEGWGERSDYVPDDDDCAGYYVNFESHLARIEGRVIRAMLTSLPTEKARNFLQKLSGGDVLSALWALTRTFGDFAVAFHSGAGVYRAGTENLAAVEDRCHGDESYPGDTPSAYDEKWDTVLVAAQCLGLSRNDLLDGDSVPGSQLPRRLPPTAFHALFRVARAACVELPLENSTDTDFVSASRKARQDSCSLVRFKPQQRPLDIELIGDGALNQTTDAPPAVGAPPP